MQLQFLFTQGGCLCADGVQLLLQGVHILARFALALPA